MDAPRILALRRARPRSRLVRVSVLLLAGLVVASWTAGDFDYADALAGERFENVRRFLTEEVLPYPLREAGFSWSGLGAWAGELWRERGAGGALSTLAIAVLAISLSGAAALLLAPLSARNLACARPFAQTLGGAARRAAGDGGDEGDARAATRIAWSALTSLVRALLILLRAVPEYVWAFLLLAMLGANAWPAVLALAIHNAGILGKLGAETIENLPPSAPRALAGLGASRVQLALAAVFPLSLSRFLLYFFYRFETCVREATVLGMLGVVSLGYWVQDARSKLFYDEMLFFVLLGAAIVLAGDLVSVAARSFVRRGT